MQRGLRYALPFLALLTAGLYLSQLTAGQETPFGAITVGGPTSPDGKTVVACDLPVELRMHNIGGMGRGGPGTGSGLCVFTSIMHAARFQNELRLWDFQKQMSHEPGGGWPEKVDAMIAKYGAGTKFIQYVGGDPSILKAALATGRMAGVTYNGHDPHYRGGISHMVSLIYFDDSQAAILDNNYVGEKELVWMSNQEFMARWKSGNSGWCVILLSPPPPPVPRN